ncbi:hypothetical protein [Gracilibacillus suaedae]|uniref:hypothetical protein n=1 Tax=Gracilibacillus suaedae TaxID=2820273 RepID=UPI001ABDBFFE|nr:hypothetical protein [Gracilibacillus suaedae]
MDETLKQVLDEIQKVNNRFDKFESRFDLLENRFDSVEKRFDKLEIRQDSFESHLERLQKGQERLQMGQDQLKDNLINGLGPYFEQIEKHIEAKNDELKDTLEDQQRVIDTLAARSIKHESEIKDSKRILKNQ